MGWLWENSGGLLNPRGQSQGHHIPCCIDFLYFTERTLKYIVYHISKKYFWIFQLGAIGGQGGGLIGTCVKCFGVLTCSDLACSKVLIKQFLGQFINFLVWGWFWGNSGGLPTPRDQRQGHHVPCCIDFLYIIQTTLKYIINHFFKNYFLSFHFGEGCGGGGLRGWQGSLRGWGGLIGTLVKLYGMLTWHDLACS